MTGANRGLGLAFTQVLLEMGAKKVYAAARNPETIKSKKHLSQKILPTTWKQHYLDSYEEFQKTVRVLNSFCNLRVNSIQGQLNGAIPSTRKGKNMDSTAFIDASSINIFDMQDMKIPGGGGGGYNG